MRRSLDIYDFAPYPYLFPNIRGKFYSLFLSVWRQHIFSLGALLEDGENFGEKEGSSEAALDRNPAV
jgi:hypothetical protein